MNHFIVVVFYTRNTIYEEKVGRLTKSLIKFNLPCYIEGIENRGSWIQNVNYKPTFIKDMLKKFPNDNIVYVDADAEFLQYPILFETLDCTIAVHLHDYTLYTQGRNKKKEILSGTIFLKNNEEVYKLVERWENECRRDPKVYDQISLEKVLNNNYYPLPANYCKIFDIMRIVKDPVIVHYQASREVKRNKGKLVSNVGRCLRSSFQESLPTLL